MGDDSGNVRLFKYPAPSLKPSFREYKGHFAAITRMVFTHGKWLISLGGMDKTLMIWRVKPFEPKPPVKERLLSKSWN
jgi:WD40 repeat protein